MILRISKSAAAAVLIGTFCIAPAAHAYVPPSGFIVKSLAQKHSGAKGIRIKTTVRALEGGKPSEETSFRAVISFDTGRNLLRSWAYGPKNEVLFAIERTRRDLTVVDQLLLQSDAAELGKALIAQGVPVKTEEELLALPDEEQRRAAEVTSMKRWAGTVAWVIGKTSEPQLWVEKGSFLPLRFVSSDHDTRFDGFRFLKGFPYPKKLVFGETGSEPLLQEELLDYAVTAVAEDFKSPISASGMTEAGRNSPSATKRLLESYFRYLR